MRWLKFTPYFVPPWVAPARTRRYRPLLTYFAGITLPRLGRPFYVSTI